MACAEFKLPEYFGTVNDGAMFKTLSLSSREPLTFPGLIDELGGGVDHTSLGSPQDF